MRHESEPKMLNPDCYLVNFDEERRILHVAYRYRVHPTTIEHLDIVFASFRKMLDKYTDSGRVYLIIDMTNIIVEPNLKSAYAERARPIIEKYVMPRGVARYGYQITRITVRASYREHMGESPNIFNSREEAYDYITSLIEKNNLSGEAEPLSIFGEDCADR